MFYLRRATRDDQEALWRVHTSAIRELCCTRYTEREIELWTARLRPESYERLVRERELFVAERDGEVVGFSQLNLDTSEVEAVFVSAGCVREGVGSKLLAKLERVARDNQLPGLHLCATLNAVEFYQSQGFEPGEPARYAINEDLQLACRRMRKRLQKG